MKVAFIGHRTIEYSDELRNRLTEAVEGLIVRENADTFLFGSKSEFNDLCHDVVTELKEKYEDIKRIFVRAEYEYIDRSYIEYLSDFYEDTFYPSQVHGAGSRAYIVRNKVMIDMCDVLIVYFDSGYSPQTMTRSGTGISFDYAKKKNKRIINLLTRN